MAITKNTHVFNIDYTNPETGEHFAGSFTCKRASINDMIKMQAKKVELSKGYYCVRDEDGNPTGRGLDEDADFTNTVLARLSVVILSAPEWWNLDELNDFSLIMAVWNEVRSFESTFRRPAGGSQPGGQKLDSGSQDAGSTQRTETDAGHRTKAVVDEEVSVALDA